MLNHSIVESLKKTSRIVFIDEDVPGGAAAYMFNKVMEEQQGYRWLDAAPKTLPAKNIALLMAVMVIISASLMLKKFLKQ